MDGEDVGGLTNLVTGISHKPYAYHEDQEVGDCHTHLYLPRCFARILKIGGKTWVKLFPTSVAE